MFYAPMSGQIGRWSIRDAAVCGMSHFLLLALSMAKIAMNSNRDSNVWWRCRVGLGLPELAGAEGSCVHITVACCKYSVVNKQLQIDPNAYYNLYQGSWRDPNYGKHEQVRLKKRNTLP